MPLANKSHSLLDCGSPRNTCVHVGDFERVLTALGIPNTHSDVLVEFWSSDHGE